MEIQKSSLKLCEHLKTVCIYCNHWYYGERVVEMGIDLTLIGMRGDTFSPCVFLDQVLSADFLSKTPNIFGGEN